jgi:SET domain-containing protein 6
MWRKGSTSKLTLVNPLQEDTVLFSIPRSLLLNTSNSKLQSLLTEEEWATLKNWTSLILTMMWESRQEDSLWKPYFAIMPVQIDSLMFWSKEELKELEGCAVRCERPFFSLLA